MFSQYRLIYKITIGIPDTCTTNWPVRWKNLSKKIIKPFYRVSTWYYIHVSHWSTFVLPSWSSCVRDVYIIITCTGSALGFEYRPAASVWTYGIYTNTEYDRGSNFRRVQFNITHSNVLCEDWLLTDIPLDACAPVQCLFVTILYIIMKLIYI